ncbi:mevalonate kinase [Flagellimonas pacifica]|uniref:Galactokinase n=1 Tax=Flagellimonas pacifica TaxID=1247520 RepID=A0A285MXC7_9FLAO|nr:galactokinase family protein [Allomuricauda parva]SNZ00466.1 galactokinase [Allomuricauda parva]
MKSEFTKERIVAQAPGRTCLFGDHQDYLGLPVIACAIDRHIKLVATLNSARKLVLNKPDINEKRIIDIDEEIKYVSKGDHLLAALKILQEYECIPNSGYDITISGNVAINAGISSSSAVVLAWIQFLTEAFGCNAPVSRELISQIAYEAEVAFHGAPGGKMDQYAIGLGNIIYLETGDALSYEMIEKPLQGLIVAESGIPKQTTGVLRELKENALLAIHKVKERVPTFEVGNIDVTDLPKYLNYVPDDLKIYLEAAVTNHDITKRALVEFRMSELDLEHIGALMNEHHRILKDYLHITVPKIDDMINGAVNAGALGAKIVGSGRGGSIVVLAKDGEQQLVVDALMKAGARDAYPVNVDKGVRIIEP